MRRLKNATPLRPSNNNQWQGAQMDPKQNNIASRLNSFLNDLNFPISTCIRKRNTLHIKLINKIDRKSGVQGTQPPFLPLKHSYSRHLYLPVLDKIW
jgi:hypothetical protein